MTAWGMAARASLLNVTNLHVLRVFEGVCASAGAGGRNDGCGGVLAPGHLSVRGAIRSAPHTMHAVCRPPCPPAIRHCHLRERVCPPAAVARLCPLRAPLVLHAQGEGCTWRRAVRSGQQAAAARVMWCMRRGHGPSREHVACVCCKVCRPHHARHKQSSTWKAAHLASYWLLRPPAAASEHPQLAGTRPALQHSAPEPPALGPGHGTWGTPTIRVRKSTGVAARAAEGRHTKLGAQARAHSCALARAGAGRRLTSRSRSSACSWSMRCGTAPDPLSRGFLA